MPKLTPLPDFSNVEVQYGALWTCDASGCSNLLDHYRTCSGFGTLAICSDECAERTLLALSLRRHGAEANETQIFVKAIERLVTLYPVLKDVLNDNQD